MFCIFSRMVCIDLSNNTTETINGSISISLLPTIYFYIYLTNSIITPIAITTSALAAIYIPTNINLSAFVIVITNPPIEYIKEIDLLYVTITYI